MDVENFEPGPTLVERVENTATRETILEDPRRSPTPEKAEWGLSDDEKGTR